MPTILARAGEKAEVSAIQPKPIKPGLLARMVMNASFSYEDADITNWWANLFVSAAHHGGNEHAVFSDMMATVGPLEARCLLSFVDRFDFCQNRDWFITRMSAMADSVDLIRDEAVAYWVGETPIKNDRLQQVWNNFSSGQIPWPLRCVRWSLPSIDSNGGSARLRQTLPWFAEHRGGIDVLERARVVKFSKVDIPVMGPSSWVETLELTLLGAKFFAACKGYALGTGA